MVDLDHGNISGGQKQKIVLARADIHNSDLLLIDEGTSAIDSKATKEILKEILKSDRTIIMIAHNLSQEMIAMFDYKIDLRKDGGKLVCLLRVSLRQIDCVSSSSLFYLFCLE